MSTLTTTNPTPESNLQTDFMSAIQKQLLGQSGMVSSTNSNLESRLNLAISGVETTRDATGKQIESAYGREKSFQEGKGATDIQTQLEGRSGFATQMVAFRNLVETTDKNLKDLDQRKGELLLQNDATAASKISELQFKALEFQQQAQQQTFTNLLGMANLGLQAQQSERLNRAQAFTEQSAVSKIGLDFGIDPTGKTLQQIVNEVAPQASAFKKQELAKLIAETNRANAEASKALKGDPGTQSFDSTTAGILANAFRGGNTSFLAGLKTNEQYAGVFKQIEQQNKTQDDYLIARVSDYAQLGNVNKIVESLSKDPNVLLSPEQAQVYAAKVMSTVKRPSSLTSESIGVELIGGIIRTVGGISKFITGRETPNYYNPITRRIERNPNYKK